MAIHRLYKQFLLKFLLIAHIAIFITHFNAYSGIKLKLYYLLPHSISRIDNYTIAIYLNGQPKM